jgi:hypothetical protein
MMTLRKTIIIRIFLSMLAGILVASVVTEMGFRLQGNTISRPPRTVILVIPKGTSAKVVQGESVIPSDMTFVVGDTLLVRNEDNVTHTLGPMIVLAGSSASLKLEQAQNLVYTCSFEPQKVFGLDIHEALTLSTRIQGFLLAGIPMGLLLAVYSLVAWPLKSKNKGPEG